MLGSYCMRFVVRVELNPDGVFGRETNFVYYPGRMVKDTQMLTASDNDTTENSKLICQWNEQHFCPGGN